MRSSNMRRGVLAGAAALTTAAMLFSAAPIALADDAPDGNAVVSASQTGGADATGDGLALVSNEQYVQTFGASKALAQGLSQETVDQAEESIAADGAAVSSAASDHWSVVKFVGTDADGRHIPTRQGNRNFGWVHFSGPHNITSRKVVKVAVSEHPEKKNGARLEYGAVLTDGLGMILARVKVIAQYSWETADHKYQLADRGQKIGVITAYCQGTNKCPDALNRV